MPLNSFWCHQMNAQSGLITAQYFFNQVILDPKEVLVVGGGNRTDSWQ